ncbi:hypothetical protein SDC9_183912 [bioreactor metagenome]|uniref:DUF1273 domain-containing protein n=1 Tax=bioreactor metagenome TaxID=1076179 RepID=A0A645HLB1_9ZZZZ
MPFGSDETCPKCRALKNKLQEETVALIKDFGVIHFISGMALGVDMFAAEIILGLQKSYPNLTLECALPCGTQAEKWNQEQKNRYFSILEQCDKVTLLQPLYTDDCMRKRNEYMADQSDYVIGVWDGTPSGTANTIAYAKQKQKKIVCVDPNTCKSRKIGF